MTRVTNAVATRRRKKRIFKRAKGFVGDRKNHLRITADAVMRALAFNYRHRKHNKRNFRKLWIIRINAAARINGLSYSKLINGLATAKCDINRKMLADLAVTDLEGFAAIATLAKGSLA
ncbi:MAG: 50S ribosomal protein L20 [Waddliaceae bacterium]|jgi:large subunit ribosomal protein L20|nr:50S ribosomal protein L20 [Candidatus Jacksonbacteria bacterium]MBT3579610.1 50S ribosomal protein L20 [Waddliaceae bacterium]MBT4444594.1 50S ribosomal protein L20 [Waddliaceae bacterium]MBT6928786.1 50S ribosomal protein L20 [Waddliaceae bacterium]MBT7264770.1 50S ribosomal protein L20 [Waddliaceae bacterium]